MAKIISTKKLKYDARDISKEAIIELEVVGFKYLMDERYLITIRDSTTEEKITYLPTVNPPAEIPEQEPLPIKQDYMAETVVTPIALREKIYSKEEVDSLFILSEDTIGPENSFTNKFEDIIQKSLLAITKMSPIYGSIAEDWETVNRK